MVDGCSETWWTHLIESMPNLMHGGGHGLERGVHRGLTSGLCHVSCATRCQYQRAVSALCHKPHHGLQMAATIPAGFSREFLRSLAPSPALAPTFATANRATDAGGARCASSLGSPQDSGAAANLGSDDAASRQHHSCHSAASWTNRPVRVVQTSAVAAFRARGPQSTVAD